MQAAFRIPARDGGEGLNKAGRVFSRLTRAALEGGAFLADPGRMIAEAREESGAVARLHFAPEPLYFVTSAETARAVLKDDEHFSKGRVWRAEAEFLAKGLLNADGPEYALLRKAAMGFYTPAQVERHTEATASVMDKHLAKWRDAGNIEARQALTEMQLEIACRIFIGDHFRVTPEFVADVKTVLSWLDRARLTSLHFPDAVRSPRFLPALSAAKNRIHQALTGHLKERAFHAKFLPNDSLADWLILKTGGQDIPMVADLIMEAVFAGHETTALALTWLVYEILRHPEMYAVVRREIREQDTLEAAPTNRAGGVAKELESLPATRAFLFESLRLHPPAWATFRQAVKNVTIGGESLPAGANVMISLYHQNRDAAAWNRPNEFDPSRFADLPGGMGAALPFGTGKRVCIGQHKALLDMVLFLKRFAREFDMPSAAYGEAGERFGFSLYPKRPIHMTFNASVEHAATTPRRDVPVANATALFLSGASGQRDGLLAMVRGLAKTVPHPIFRVPVRLDASWQGIALRSLVMATDPWLIKQVLSAKADGFGRTGPLVEDLPVIFGKNSVLVHSAENRDFARRMHTPFAVEHSAKAAAALVGSWTESMSRLAASWQQGEVVDVHAAMVDYSFASVLEPILDADERTMAKLRHLTRALTTGGNRRIFRAVKGPMRLFDNPLLTALSDTDVLLNEIVQRQEQRWHAGDLSENGFFGYMLKNGFTASEMRDQLKTSLFAGIDTMSSALTYLLYSLATHPNARDKAYREIRERIGDKPPAELTEQDLRGLSYSWNVVNETLRLYPVVWGVQRSVLKDTVVGNYRVREGDLFVASLYELHRDKRLWGQDADDFVPERFARLNATQQEFYAPFGEFGPHVCPARRRAPLEMLCALAALAKLGVDLKPTKKKLDIDVGVAITPKSFTAVCFTRTPRS